MELFLRKYLIVFIFLLASSLFGQNQTFFLDKNYPEVLEISKSNQKPILLMFHAKWCPHCNKMKKEVFPNEELIAFYTTNFNCLSIDIDTENGKYLREKFKNNINIKYFPTFAFLDSSETLLASFSGEFNSQNFISEGKKVLIKDNQLPTLKATFLAETSNPQKCLNYITALRRAEFDATEMTKLYLKTKKSEELFSEINWQIMANGVNKMDSDEFKFIVENQEAFLKVISDKRINRKIQFVVKENIKSFVESLDTVNYNRNKKIAQNFHIKSIDSLLFKYDLIVYENTENFEAYQKTSQQNANRFAWNDANTLNEISLVFLNNIQDKKAIEEAIEWSERSLKLNETIGKYYLIIKLMLKNKEFDKAMSYATIVKKKVESFQMNTNEIENLIAQIKNKKQWIPEK
ncbi:thioredoxin family protein [Flavobacterium sp.]|uniref:thioredoxin family protein n=1 Tax=Flavobacterium sp. TaxID=239 RepID=UPI00391B80C9